MSDGPYKPRSHLALKRDLSCPFTKPTEEICQQDEALDQTLNMYILISLLWGSSWLISESCFQSTVNWNVLLPNIQLGCSDVQSINWSESIFVSVWRLGAASDETQREPGEPTVRSLLSAVDFLTSDISSKNETPSFSYFRYLELKGFDFYVWQPHLGVCAHHQLWFSVWLSGRN